jgi:MFS superfamily sulfate permease-like transporter
MQKVIERKTGDGRQMTSGNGGTLPRWSRENLSRDFGASIVVFLVALPLCMGIAMASGMPPQAGIITGIIGGLVVGPLSGCPLQISGPAAGLAVIVYELLQEHGPEKLCMIIMLGGAIQMIAGYARIAHWFRAVPPSVVNGMLSGIGVLIFASQFHVMVDDTSKGTGIQNLISIPMAVYKGIIPGPEAHHVAAMIGLMTIAVVLIWDKVKRGPLKLIPGTLVAIIAATLVASFYKLPINFVQIPSSLLGDLKPADFSVLQRCYNWEFLFDGLAIAFVAAAETLLTATAVDKMHKGERTNYDRELIAQGVGNLSSGFLGGLPMTGVMVRSGVNVSAGGRTRASAFMHGLWLLLFIAFLPFVIRMIPTSSLAALLVLTGWKLCNFQIISELKSFGKSEVAVYALTVICIVAVDLLTGVLLGIALCLAKLLYIFSHLDIRVADDLERNRTDIFLKGASTFLSLPRFADALESVRPDTELHVHLEGLSYIDHACLDLMVNWEEQHLAGGGKLVMDWGRVEACYQDRRSQPRPQTVREFRRYSTPSAEISSASEVASEFVQEDISHMSNDQLADIQFAVQSNTKSYESPVAVREELGSPLRQDGGKNGNSDNGS